MDKTTVFLSDWQVLFREGIHFTLSGEEDLIVTGETTTNEDALEFVLENPPDVAIVNVNHSEFSGVEFTRKVKRQYQQVSVILVMDTDNDASLFAALKCGASACVAKDIDPDDLVKIIRQIAVGIEPMHRSILRSGIASTILGEFEEFAVLDGEVEDLLAKLAPKEKSLLEAIARGETIDSYTSSSGLDDEEVQTLLRMIRVKLERNEQSRSVVEASQRGLSAVIGRTGRKKKQDTYISREEFEAFKEDLIDHFRTFTGK